MTLRTRTTRRWLVGAVAALAAGTVALRELPLLLRHHYRHRRTAYDDLFSNLGDRESSVAFGRVANRNAPGSSGSIAAFLRQRLRTGSLRSVATNELSHGQVFVAGGWVVPESLALICALAARES
jgi:hypothetical protein